MVRREGQMKFGAGVLILASAGMYSIWQHDATVFAGFLLSYLAGTGLLIVCKMLFERKRQMGG